MSLETVKVYPDTKSRLDKFRKRSGSYDKIICSFLDYFDATGVKPNEIQSSPISIVKDRTDAIISLMRGIEKKQKPMLTRIENNLEVLLEQIGGKFKDNLTPEEGEILAHKIIELEGNLTLKIDEISQLKKQLLAKTTTNIIPENDFENTKVALRNTTKKLKESVNSSRMDSSNYQISKITFDSIIDSFYNLTK